MSKRYAPRYWGTWLVVGVGWLVARLPLRWVVTLGRALGRLAYYLAGGRRHIGEVNLRLCLPELAPQQRKRLLREHFQHLGVWALETATAWLNPHRALDAHVQVHGIDALRQAQKAGRGVLLLGGHFTCIDFVAQTLTRLAPLDVMYRRNKSPVWEWLQVRGRRRYHDAVIERGDIRQTLSRLKAGHTVWYAPDQDYGPKHSLFAPFFGVPAATITAPQRLAAANDSPAVFMAVHRDWTNLQWHVELSAIDDYPSGSKQADATRINALVEAAARAHPEQYLWIHRRFKTRPDGESRPY